MKCKICNKFINLNITFNNFFDKDDSTICDSCLKKYPLHISYNTYEVGIYTCHIFSLFSEKYYFKNDPFYEEYNRIFNYIIKKANDSPILLYDNLYLSQNMDNILEILSELYKTDIYILCNFFDV
jgi:hypothetical protein